MGRYCDHQFYALLPDHGTENKIYIPIVCCYCGQVRHLYGDGQVLIVKEEGEVKKAYVNTSNTNNKTA